MTRIPGTTGIALLGVASAVLVASPIEGNAQSRLEDHRQSLAALGAAIDEVKRSPFHRVGQVGPGVNLRTVGGTAWPIQANGTALAIGSGPSSHQEAAQAESERDVPRAAGFAMVLGAAAGDIASYALASKHGGVGFFSLLTLSPSLTTLATSWAGVSPGTAFVSSFLGTACGVGAGLGTLFALAEPLYLLAIVPATIVYYGVRFGVTMTAMKRLERKARDRIPRTSGNDASAVGR